MKKYILIVSFLLIFTYPAWSLKKLNHISEIKKIASAVTKSEEESNDNKPVFTEIIDEVDGVKESYLRYGSGYFPYMGMVYQYFEDTEPSPSIIVYGNDNKIYLQDIMDFGWDSYVEGSISGNKITMELPQTIFEEQYAWAEEPFYQNLCVMTQSGEGENLNFEYDGDITKVTFTISENGIITLDPLPEGKALGVMTYFLGKEYDTPEDEKDGNDNYTLTWIDAWSGAADYTQIFKPLGIELIEMPENETPVTYQVLTNGYNYPVDVIFKDNYMYINGIGDSKYIDNFVIRATVDGNKVYIPQDQYVGVFSWDNEMAITKCGYENNNGQIIFSEPDVSYEMKIDPDKHILTPADPEMYLCYAYMMIEDPSTNQNAIIYTFYFKNFSMIYQDSYPGIPMNPKIINFRESPGRGYSSVGFDMLCFSTNGKVILSGDLYYSIYVNGEREVFEYQPGVEIGEYSKYYMLPEPTDEIPFLFTNDNEFYIWSETERSVGVYYEGITTIGVQAVYYCDDLRTTSDIVTLNVDTGEITTGNSGVTQLQNEIEIKKIEYYDLNGRKTEHPQTGIYVKRIFYTNDKIVSRKVIVK